jgi:hypothetical protein
MKEHIRVIVLLAREIFVDMEYAVRTLLMVIAVYPTVVINMSYKMTVLEYGRMIVPMEIVGVCAMILIVLVHVALLMVMVVYLSMLMIALHSVRCQWE